MRIKTGEDKEAIERRGNNLFQNIRYREKDRSRGGENEKGEKRRDGREMVPET